MKNLPFTLFFCLLFTLSSLAQTHQTHLISYTTFCMEVVDIDGDGDKDILSGGFSNLQWQESNGNGLFTSHTINQNYDETQAVKAVDIDADGDMDIIASSFTTNQLIWLDNDGNQNFTENYISSNSGSSAGIDAIDFDLDGDIDIIGTGYNSDEIYWMQNDGNQAFTKILLRTSFDGAASIIAKDIDGDNDIDIFASGILNDSIIFLKNNGMLSFTQQFVLGIDGPRKLRFVDYDTDGDIDITYAADGGFGWLKNTNASFTVNNPATTNCRDYYATDLDNDNDKDLVTTNYVEDDVLWQTNNGSQTFTGMGFIDSNLDNPSLLGVSDFTGDGYTDVIGASGFEVKLYTNNNGLSFTKKRLNLYLNTVKWACIGDFDNDGDQDLMAIGYFNIIFYRNDGNDIFVPAPVFSTNQSFGGEDIKTADVDGDGDDDAVYSQGVDNRIGWLENQGGGIFVDRLVFNLVDPNDIYPIDYDFDGDMDVIGATVETFSLSAIYWYENDGNENFTQNLVNANYSFPNGLFPLDYNNDGLMDVVAAYSGTGGSNKIILHYGGGNLSSTVNNSCQGASSVYAIDIDNDSDMDLLSAGFNDNKIIWYENPGFVQHIIDNTAQGATHVFAGDIDGDGDIDVASTSATDDKVSWYENNGNQSFSKKSLAGNIPYPEMIGGGDIDGDGVMDLYSVCKQTHSVALYKKAPAPPPLSLSTCGDLFISEYIEGTSNNKAIEIYNATLAAIDLSTYEIGVYQNGASSPTQTVALLGTIAANGVYVLAHQSSIAAILNAADQTFGFSFNGDDAIGLLKGGQLIDIVGKIGEDPGSEWSSGGASTLDKTLVRKNTISKGSNLNINFVTNNEWDAYAIDDASHLGAHTSQCANYCPASVTINASTTNFCSGTSVTFTTSAVNQGATPIYQWKKNGVNVATGATYTTATLANNDTIKCIMTSSQICAIDPSNSNSIIVTVSPSVTPSISISASATTICSGTNITITANGTNGGNAPTFVWKKNGITVGTNSPSYSNSALINNDVITCVFTSNIGCVTSNNIVSNGITITVNPSSTPSISIATNNTTICEGTNISFTATPTNGGTTPIYQWYKNNNPISGATSVTYLTSTTVNNDIFKCILTSNSACATAPTATSNNITITVNPLPVASTILAGGPTTFCAGGSAVLSGNNNGGTWSNGATTSTITVTTTGSYFLTNSNSCGSINSNTINITANPAPITSTISAGGATTFCAGNTVTLSGNNSGGTWSNGATTATINVNISGNYFVTNSNNCGTINSNTISVTVNPLPTAATITANGPTTICTGSTVTLSGNNNGGTWSNGATTSSINITSAGNYFVTNTNGCGSVNSNTINVIVSNGPVASTIAALGSTTFCAGNTVTLNGNNGGTWSNGATTPSIVVNTGGDYYVTNTDACGSITSNNIIVTVNPQPMAAIISAIGATSICNGNSVQLTGNVDGTWSSGVSTNSITVTTAGNYFVTNTNACGTINSNSINVIVDSLPTAATITAFGSTTICAGNTAVLTGNIDGVWSDGNTTPAIAVSTSGSYFVTNTNGCGTTTSNQIVVTVLPAPNTPVVTQVGYNLETTSGYNSYQWFNNNFPIPNETNAIFTPTSSGDYYVLVIDSNGCQAQSTVYNFVYVGKIEIASATEITLMPNPANTFIVLQSSNKTDLNGNLKVWSINGDLMLEKNLIKSNQYKIDIEQWANGMYLIELIKDNKTERFKFIKQQ